MDRTLIPRISAACHHVINFAIAFKITSCTFIARSAVALRKRSMLYLRIEPFPGATQERTFHVLIKADISCATHTHTYYNWTAECWSVYTEVLGAEYSTNCGWSLGRNTGYASLCRTGLPIARGAGNTGDILLSPASGVGYCRHKRIYPCNSRSFL